VSDLGVPCGAQVQAVGLPHSVAIRAGKTVIGNNSRKVDGVERLGLHQKTVGADADVLHIAVILLLPEFRDRHDERLAAGILCDLRELGDVVENIFRGALAPVHIVGACQDHAVRVACLPQLEAQALPQLAAHVPARRFVE